MEHTHTHTYPRIVDLAQVESLFAALQTAKQIELALAPLFLSLSPCHSASLSPKGNAIKKVACNIRNNLQPFRAEISANKLALNLCAASLKQIGRKQSKSRVQRIAASLIATCRGRSAANGSEKKSY